MSAGRGAVERAGASSEAEGNEVSKTALMAVIAASPERDARMLSGVVTVVAVVAGVLEVGVVMV